VVCFLLLFRFYYRNQIARGEFDLMNDVAAGVAMIAA